MFCQTMLVLSHSSAFSSPDAHSSFPHPDNHFVVHTLSHSVFVLLLYVVFSFFVHHPILNNYSLMPEWEKRADRGGMWVYTVTAGSERCDGMNGLATGLHSLIVCLSFIYCIQLLPDMIC